MSTFYELQSPTGWAAPPELWSSTTIDEVGACPRRWQLLRSPWGEFPRFPVRQHPAAIEGQVIHEALDRLTRACGQLGNPALGTPAFSEAAAKADFFGGFAKALEDWQERLGRHPRPGPAFRLRISPQELANRAVRLFRAQYRPGSGVPAAAAVKASTDADAPLDHAALLRVKGALSEVRLRHGSLPFMGVLDRVQLGADGVEIVDFKTGKASEAHLPQLLRYAVLWWRSTGDVPVGVTAQYLDGARSWLVSRSDVAAAETELAAKIDAHATALKAQPAPASPSSSCLFCAVRARCDEGWGRADEAARAEGRGDAELSVESPKDQHGFLTRDKNGAEVAVVYEAAVAALVPAVRDGQVVRIVDGVRRAKGSELEIRAWTEVYVVGGSRAA